MPTYTKLFNSIITSTIWSEDDKTRIIWITMLAISDKNGEVHASIPGLGRVAGMTTAEAEAAIGKLMSPDPYSRTPDNEGRRIAKIDGGWELLNHAKYRLMASKEDEKAATAARVKRLRARNATVTPCNGGVTVGNAPVTQDRDIAEADTDTDITPQPPKGGACDRKRFQKPTIDEVDAYGKTLTPPFTRALQFCAHYESNGWKVGKNAMKDWRAAVRTWHLGDKHNQKQAKQKFKGMQEEIPFTV